MLHPLAINHINYGFLRSQVLKYWETYVSWRYSIDSRFIVFFK